MNNLTAFTGLVLVNNDAYIDCYGDYLPTQWKYTQLPHTIMELPLELFCVEKVKEYLSEFGDLVSQSEEHFLHGYILNDKVFLAIATDDY